MASTIIDFKKLLSACVHLSRIAGHTIRETHKEGQLGAHNKKDASDKQDGQKMEAADVLTIADLRAQHVIVSNLRTMFPNIRIVGEEDEGDAKSEASKLGETPSISLADVPVLEDLIVPSDLAEALTLKDTCLWIDPLDGTIEFVRGNLHNVCVLIGIAVRDRPVAGVVLQPFVVDENPNGCVTYGAAGVGVFGDRVPAQSDAPNVLTLGAEEKSLKLPRIQKSVEILRSTGIAEPVVSQGAGQNLLKVLRGETSFFIQGPGASRWDSCANEALLLAVGGKVTNLDGSPYQYVQDAPNYLNSEGLIAGRTEDIHSQVLNAVLASTEMEESAEKRAKTS
mmetsp:Transcript_3119/g.5046  ORF Transcript_3119/g.5046 Transcript_3119/m.5046 type:complete len:338 (-) Transcript_3119:169-1182(-)